MDMIAETSSLDCCGSFFQNQVLCENKERVSRQSRHLRLTCCFRALVWTSGANREFMFLDPNICPIFLGNHRNTRPALIQFLPKHMIFYGFFDLSFQGYLIVKPRNTNRHNLPGYAISILNIGNNLG